MTTTNISPCSEFTRNLYNYQRDFHNKYSKDPSFTSVVMTHIVGRIISIAVTVLLHLEAVWKAFMAFLTSVGKTCSMSNEELIQIDHTFKHSKAAFGKSWESFESLFSRKVLEREDELYPQNISTDQEVFVEHTGFQPLARAEQITPREPFPFTEEALDIVSDQEPFMEHAAFQSLARAEQITPREPSPFTEEALDIVSDQEPFMEHAAFQSLARAEQITPREPSPFTEGALDIVSDQEPFMEHAAFQPLARAEQLTPRELSPFTEEELDIFNDEELFMEYAAQSPTRTEQITPREPSPFTEEALDVVSDQEPPIKQTPLKPPVAAWPRASRQRPTFTILPHKLTLSDEPIDIVNKQEHAIVANAFQAQVPSQQQTSRQRPIFTMLPHKLTLSDEPIDIVNDENALEIPENQASLSPKSPTAIVDEKPADLDIQIELRSRASRIEKWVETLDDELPTLSHTPVVVEDIREMRDALREMEKREKELEEEWVSIEEGTFENDQVAALHPDTPQQLIMPRPEVRKEQQFSSLSPNPESSDVVSDDEVVVVNPSPKNFTLSLPLPPRALTHLGTVDQNYFSQRGADGQTEPELKLVQERWLDLNTVLERLREEVALAAQQKDQQTQIQYISNPRIQPNEQWMLAGKTVGKYKIGGCHFTDGHSGVEHVETEILIRGKRVPLMGIFDPQISKAAQFLRVNLAEALQNHLGTYNEEQFSAEWIYNGISNSFFQLNQLFGRKFPTVKHEGASATFALEVNDELWVISAGSTRAALSNGGEVIQCTKYDKDLGFGFNSSRNSIPNITRYTGVQANSHLIIGTGELFKIAGTQTLVSWVFNNKNQDPVTLARDIVNSVNTVSRGSYACIVWDLNQVDWQVL